ncbi:ABC transporter ATP-binding protein [Streptomyces bambusae]|uniref:ATP-binding cassette domain-containing protein n=1 Tax=Streptomyces bambusae TaxID=1550616 RepID=UPI001CFE3012|nr:ABC transporter ATP-binding protein [Streptomyces bambusae]MCB5167765.1 ABC transporter ATP-binding protein [Streptomyces bambusae]
MNDPTAAPALRATAVEQRFKGTTALQDCTFDLPAGRIAALVGPNGAGKSTLLHLAAGLLRPTGGEVRVFGSEPGTPPALGRTAFVSQDRPLFPQFTVADTLAAGRRLNRTWDQAEAERIVRAGNIPLTARIGTLSGGRRTRVALALALAKRADLLLLDEPLADLDPLVRHEITGLLMAEAAERGTTVVISSHVLPELEDVCDHVLLVQDGRIRLAGDTDDLREAHTRLTGRADPSTPDGLPTAADRGAVVHAATTGRQLTAVIRNAPGTRRPAGFDGTADTPWITATPSLEQLLLAHLRAPAAAHRTEAAA